MFLCVCVCVCVRVKQGQRKPVDAAHDPSMRWDLVMFHVLCCEKLIFVRALKEGRALQPSSPPPTPPILT